MQFKDPKVILLASTGVHYASVGVLLESLGANGWETEAQSSSEELTEIAGRLCYKAFGTELNKNLTKVREGNKQYVENILKQHHGSVLEHSSVSFALLDVSRILTHELVRHRAGTAFSQESGRFVRLDNIGFYYPDALAGDYLTDYVAPHVEHDGESDADWGVREADKIEGLIQRHVQAAEDVIKEITETLQLDKAEIPFGVKKYLTSALRRLAPAGQTNDIIVTANHRAWRHLIEVRTALGAEEEIRKVFFEIGKQLKDSFPNIYQDMTPIGEQFPPVWEFTHSKV